MRRERGEGGVDVVLDQGKTGVGESKRERGREGETDRETQGREGGETERERHTGKA